MSTTRAPGFTLIELLITVTILGIIMSLATAGYGQYIRRANRVDATAALLRLASAQEKHYSQNGQYADAGDMGNAPPAGLGIAGTERGYYSLDMELAAGGAAVGFTATATVADAGPQTDDSDCWTFTINERGLRTAETQEGDTDSEITDRCWR